MADTDLIPWLLERARWAPSGDNTQPWRFEVRSPARIAIHGHDTRDWCLYDFDGRASQMAHGALLETLRIAASAKGLAATWGLAPDSSEAHPIYLVDLSPDPQLDADPLVEHIEQRTVQRRPMRTTPLSAEQRAALVAAVGPDYRLQLFDTLGDRWAIAKLLWNNARIRLTCPEAFQVHREIIEWGARFSKDRIPERAVGVDPLTAGLMRWVMQSWGRVEFFNRYLLGTVAPRIQLDLVPALACAAHVLIRPAKPLEGIEDYVRLGVAMQRMWLAATSVGLHLQPEMTPVIFRWYARAGRRFSAVEALAGQADRLASAFERLSGAGAGDPFGFFCRVGVSEAPPGRSRRLEVAELMLERPRLSEEEGLTPNKS